MYIYIYLYIAAPLAHGRAAAPHPAQRAAPDAGGRGLVRLPRVLGDNNNKDSNNGNSNSNNNSNNTNYDSNTTDNANDSNATSNLNTNTSNSNEAPGSPKNFQADRSLQLELWVTLSNTLSTSVVLFIFPD